MTRPYTIPLPARWRKGRTKDRRRATIHHLAQAMAETRPDASHYTNESEYHAAVYVWDDTQRSIVKAIARSDRREHNVSDLRASFAALIRGAGNKKGW